MIDSFTTTNPADDNLDANFEKIVPPECKENHSMYVAYKLAYASTHIQKQCKYCGNVVYIGTDTEEELKKIPTWFTPSDARRDLIACPISFRSIVSTCCDFRCKNTIFFFFS